MTRNIALSRPATSAIAAFLVLTAPSAFAQETPSVPMTSPVAPPPVVAPAPQTPPTVAEPSMTAPVATPQTAEPQTPKPVIRVPLDIAPAETTPAPQSADRAVPTERAASAERTASAPAPAERTATRTRTAAAAPVAAAPVASDNAADAAPTEDLAPTAAPVMTTAEPAAQAAPMPSEQAQAPGSEFPWEIAGGAAALLIVGGAGLAFARRRRVVGDHTDNVPVAASERTVTAAPAVGETQPWITPAYTAAPQPAAQRSTPAFAAAPSGSMGRHEAMALAGPTPDNPFATLSKRLKRARFLDRQERNAYDATLAAQKDMTRKPVSAWEISQRPAAPAVQQQDVRRPEPARGRPDLRPGFARN